MLNKFLKNISLKGCQIIACPGPHMSRSGPGNSEQTQKESSGRTENTGDDVIKCHNLFKPLMDDYMGKLSCMIVKN
jgi:hypothetical protein